MGFSSSVRNRIKKCAIKNKKEMTPKDLFGAQETKTYIANVVRSMTGRNLRVTVEDDPTVCDMVGCTNNTSMYINPFSDIVTSMGGLEAQFVTCMGIVFHEIAHCVYLDFDEEKRACEFLEKGMLYGDEPYGLTLKEQATLEELKTVLADEAARPIFVYIYHQLANIISDRHDEDCLIYDYRSFVGEPIYLARNSLLTSCIPFEEGLKMVENGDLPKISFLFNNLLQMTRFDKVFSHDYDSVEKTEYWKFLEQIREHAAIACATDDVMRKCTEITYIIMGMLPYIKEQIQENQQQEQADSQQSQQNSQQSSSGSQQSSTSSSGSQSGQNGMPQMSSQDIEKILNQLAQGASQGSAPQTPQMNCSSQKAQNMRNAERDGSKEQRSERQASGNDSAAKDALERLAGAIANRQAENEVSQENLHQDSVVLNLASQTSSHANYGSQVVLPHAVTQDDIDTYNFMMKDLAAYSKRLQRQMLDILKDLREGTVSKHRAFGRKFDARDAYRPDQKYFMSKKNPTEIPDMSIFVLIDHSGSMNGERMEAAQKAAMLLYDFATNIDIPVAVAGHNDRGSVFFKLYTGFEKASRTEKYRLAQMEPSGRNRDGMAINMASAMLEKRQEEIRMLIIISDGQPNSRAYSGEEAARDIQDIIGKLRRKNIEVLAAGIGEDRERVKEIYGNDNYIDISDLSALPKILTNVVRKKVYAAM